MVVTLASSRAEVEAELATIMDARRAAFAGDVVFDPYPRWHELREAGPVLEVDVG